jgi:hypothetical protein
MNRDSKAKSFSEVMTNIILSFPVHYFANFLILPPYAEHIMETSGDFAAASILYLQLGFWFTLISIIRQFLLRRLYNRLGYNSTGINIFKTIYKSIRNEN